MKKIYLIAACLICSGFLLAQTSPTYELSSTGANTSAQGPSVDSQKVSFSRNAYNPDDNVFTTPAVPLALTFSLSNQQYANADNTYFGLMFGATGDNNTVPRPSFLYRNLGVISNPTNSMFTSVTGSSGGIESDATTISSRNFGIYIHADVEYIGNGPRNGKYYFADLTLTFDKPVNNPVLQISALGGDNGNINNNLGFSVEFELISAGYKLSKLDGNSNLKITDSIHVENISSNKSGSTSEMAAGSVLVNGSAIRSLVFKVYVEGDGGPGGWGVGDSFRPGDSFLVGVSLADDDIVLPITLERFTTTGSGCKVKVDFKTGVEDNVNYIRLQHSNAENGSFKDIYQWQPKGDNSSYQYLHETNSRRNFYRLAITDNDSSKTYSHVSMASVSANCMEQVMVYPNPVNDHINIQGTFAGDYAVNLIDTKGRLLQNINLVRGQSLQTINTSQLVPGQYFLLIKDNNGIVLTRPVIKQ